MSDGRVLAPHMFFPDPGSRGGRTQRPPHGAHGSPSPSAGVGNDPRPSSHTLGFSTGLWCWYAIGSMPLGAPQAGDGSWQRQTEYFNGRTYATAWVWYPSTPTVVRGRTVVTGSSAPAGFVQVLPGYWVKV